MTRRNTVQKQAVLEAVRAAQPGHPTAADIWNQVRPALPHLAFGTVYRVLHGLASEQRIRELPQTSGPMRYDADMSGHYHVVCTRCGAMGDVYLASSIDAEACGMARASFEIADCQLEFRGLCPDCAQSSKQERDGTIPC